MKTHTSQARDPARRGPSHLLRALRLSIGGESIQPNTRSLHLVQSGREIQGPVLQQGELNQLTLYGDAQGTSLLTPDQGRFTSTPFSGSPGSVFPSLGGVQAVAESPAQAFFQGGVSELLLFDYVLDPSQRAQIEEYRRARWEGWRVWDHRDETLPITLSAGELSSHVLVGGWGSDTLQGGPLADLLQGGPGPDRISGGDGPDRFEVLPDGGDDTLTDFSPEQGDVLDLSALLAGRDGSPTQYLALRFDVIRGTDNGRQARTRIAIDREGDGGEPDQVLTLMDLGFSGSDLPRLVGEGTLLLGGPQFPLAVSITAEHTTLPRDGRPYAISVRRTGNLDAAIDVPLSFTGDARIDQDYLVNGASGSGAVRKLHLDRGMAQASIDLVPSQGGNSAQIDIQVLPAAAITDRPVDPLVLTLEGMNWLTIHTLRHLERGDATPGRVAVRRSGEVDRALTIQLQYGGSLVNGQDYQTLPTQLALAPGETSRELEVHLTSEIPVSDEVDEIQIRLGQAPERYALVNPDRASVLVLPAGGASTPTYAQWQQSLPAGSADLMDYVTGTSSDPDEGRVHIEESGARVQLRLTTIANLTDVGLSIVCSAALDGWQDVTDRFTSRLLWEDDGRVTRIYESPQPTNAAAFYRITARPLDQ